MRKTDNIAARAARFYVFFFFFFWRQHDAAAVLKSFVLCLYMQIIRGKQVIVKGYLVSFVQSGHHDRLTDLKVLLLSEVLVARTVVPTNSFPLFAYPRVKTRNYVMRHDATPHVLLNEGYWEGIWPSWIWEPVVRHIAGNCENSHVEERNYPF